MTPEYFTEKGGGLEISSDQRTRVDMQSRSSGVFLAFLSGERAGEFQPVGVFPLDQLYGVGLCLATRSCMPLADLQFGLRAFLFNN